MFGAEIHDTVTVICCIRFEFGYNGWENAGVADGSASDDAAAIPFYIACDGVMIF